MSATGSNNSPRIFKTLVASSLLAAAVFLWLQNLGENVAVPTPPPYFATILVLPLAFAVQTLFKLFDLREGKELSELTSSSEKRRLKEVVASKLSKVSFLIVYYFLAACAIGVMTAVTAGDESLKIKLWSFIAFLFVITLSSIVALVSQRAEITDFIERLNNRNTLRLRKQRALNRLNGSDA